MIISDEQECFKQPNEYQTFREWMRRIATRASGPGGGNSIFRSIRPGRSNAASKISETT